MGLGRRATLALLFAAACGEPTGPEPYQCVGGPIDQSGGGALMFPGESCLDCHGPGGVAGIEFSAAGTVFAAPDCTDAVLEAHVFVRDSQANELELITNAAGNFYTQVPLTPPLYFAVRRPGAHWNRMVRSVDAGSCGSCHGPDKSVGFVAPR